MLDVPLGKDFPRASVESLIKKHIKKGQDVEIAPYRMAPHYGRTHWEGDLYLETHHGIKLLYGRGREAYTIAFVGFEVHRDSLKISQLQGLIEASEILRPLRWERALMEAVIILARATPGCEEVQVRPAESLTFYNMPHYLKRPLEEHRAALRLRYDITAKRLGFEWSAKSGTYVLSTRTGR